MNYENKPLCQINIINDSDHYWFEVFNYDAPYLTYQTDDQKDLLDYIDNIVSERI